MTKIRRAYFLASTVVNLTLARALVRVISLQRWSDQQHRKSGGVYSKAQLTAVATNICTAVGPLPQRIAKYYYVCSAAIATHDNMAL